MIVRPAPASHFAWIAERAKLVVGPAFGAIEAITDPDAPGERIHGMVGYDGWTPNSVSMHIALDNPAALRAIVRPGFGIAFRQTDRKIATCLVLSTNDRSKRLVRHLGFREVFRGRNYWSKGVDMLLFEMRRAECRYLDRNHATGPVDNEPARMTA